MLQVTWRQVLTKRCALFQTVWPDLAKFGHLVKTLKAFGYSIKVNFVFGKILTLTGQIFMILDKISLLLMAQNWKDNLAIWSHFFLST